MKLLPGQSEDGNDQDKFTIDETTGALSFVNGKLRISN